jgi:hypothetical protein
VALKLPRTIRLDPSDTFVFARAAEPGEWAVTGTFLFYGANPAELAGQEKQAFRAGFLGINSFGWSTLVVVNHATEEERVAAIQRLAEQLVKHCGAPDVATARLAAEEEIGFAASLCDHPEGTLLGLHRNAEGEGIRESFRTLHRRGARLQPIGAFRLVEIEEEEEPAEEVDLVAMVKDGRP